MTPPTKSVANETIRAGSADPRAFLKAQSRWSVFEILFWLATLSPFFLFPTYLSLASQIAITALFAVSLDLILGYAGIISLGHAVFFGVGAYTAGIVSKYGWGEPITGLFISAFAAAIVGYITSFLIVRVQHLALLMITLGLGFIVSVGRWIGAPVPVAAGLFAIGGAIVGEDFAATGRTLETLGLAHLTPPQMTDLLREGI